VSSDEKKLRDKNSDEKNPMRKFRIKIRITKKIIKNDAR